MNHNLISIFCYDNYFSFAILPIQDASWFFYDYAPQKSITVLKVISLGAKIDLSDQYIINGNITNYIWKRQNNTELEQGTDYTIDEGRTLFLKTQIDSVFCEMTNSTFPDLTGTDALKTTNVKIEDATLTDDILFAEPEIYSCNNTIFIDLRYDAQMSIFDINGRLVASKSVNSGLNTIQIPNPGIYFVKASCNEGLIVRKMVIQ
jgi:hypothetical protein